MAEKVWFISDTHFFHLNIIKYCNRPFKDEYEMNEIMIQKWNDRIQKDDMVFHVGDLVAGVKGRHSEVKEITKKLNGQIVLIKGNHDHYSTEFYNSMNISIYDYFAFDAGEFGNILLNHYPCGNEDKFERQASRLMKKYNCKYIIHGHKHALGDEFENHYNVCVDRNDFYPLDFDMIIEKFSTNKY